MKILIFLFLPFSLLAQKKNDNQIILSTPDSASIVYKQLFQYMMQHNFEVINKDDKNYQVTARIIPESPEPVEIKVNVNVQRTDSTRVYITGTYPDNTKGKATEKPIVYATSPSTPEGQRWINMAQLVEVYPTAKVRYTRKR